MITPTEVQKIVDQVNMNFADDRRRLKELEETVKGLQEIAQKTTNNTPKRATKEATQ